MAIQVVIAGMGQRGREWVTHVRSSPAFQLTACVDVDQQTLETGAVSLNIPAEQCFTDLSTALEKSHCQAVIVATPPDCHVQPCEESISRGLAVMVEKPFSMRLDDAIRMVLLADRKGVPLLVAQNYRYMRSFRTARQVIADGVLGQIGMVICHYFRPAHQMAASLARLPNSVIWGVAVHHIDALRHVLQKDVTGVAADSFKFPGGELLTGASFSALLSFEGETRASYTASYESTGHEFFERGQEFYLRFVGQKATLHVFQRWLILYEGRKLPRIIKRGAREFTEEQILLKQFERAILHNEPAEITGRDNLKTVAVLEASLRSAEERRWINPQDLLNEHSL